MFAGIERLEGQIQMESGGDRDHDGIDAGIFDGRSVILVTFAAPESPAVFVSLCPFTAGVAVQDTALQ
jgi:hypothetical protein